MESIFEAMRVTGWAFAFFLLGMIMIGFILVEHELWRYLRDRNEREAAEARRRSLLPPVKVAIGKRGTDDRGDGGIR